MASNTEFAFVAPGAEGYQRYHAAAAHINVLDADQGVIDFPMDRKKIAICGFASSSRPRIPFTDPAWMIAGLNQLYRHIPRADVWFDIHLNWREDNVEGTDHPAWIKQCGIPVFMADLDALKPEPREAYPTAVRFPIERLIEKHGLDYFTSTVSFMLAWAIDEIDRAVDARMHTIAAISARDLYHLIRSLYTEYTIGVFGIDLIVGTEYDWQKACVEYWLGEASARGITVYLPPETALCKQLYRYGYQTEPDQGVLKLSEIKRRQAEIAAQRDQTLTKVYGLQGAVQAVKRIEAIDADAAGDLAKVRTEYEGELQKAVALAQTLDGAAQENAHTASVIELRLRGGQIPLSAAA